MQVYDPSPGPSPVAIAAMLREMFPGRFSAYGGGGWNTANAIAENPQLMAFVFHTLQREPELELKRREQETRERYLPIEKIYNPLANRQLQRMLGMAHLEEARAARAQEREMGLARLFGRAQEGELNRQSANERARLDREAMMDRERLALQGRLLARQAANRQTEKAVDWRKDPAFNASTFSSAIFTSNFGPFVVARDLIRSKYPEDSPEYIALGNHYMKALANSNNDHAVALQWLRNELAPPRPLDDYLGGGELSPRPPVETRKFRWGKEPEPLALPTMFF